MSGCDVVLLEYETTEIIEIMAPGPQGPQGAMGPPGSSSGPIVTVTDDSSIPVGQTITLINATGPTTQTLPPISEALVGGIGNTYTIRDLSDNQVTVLGSGSDLIEGTTSDVFEYDGTARTYAPSSSGWWKI
jgi:hypothetical protein